MRPSSAAYHGRACQKLRRPSETICAPDRGPSRAHSRAAGSARRSSILDWGPLPGGGASSTAPSDVGFGLISPAIVLWPATAVVLWRRKKMCFAVTRNAGGERSSKTIRRCEDVRARSGCLYPADSEVRGQPLFFEHIPRIWLSLATLIS
jgi:hypothetical protein